MERTEEFELALREAELLKKMTHGGVIARQFLLLVQENSKLEFLNKYRKSNFIFLGCLVILFQLLLLSVLIFR